MSAPQRAERKHWLCRLGLHSYGLAPADPAAQKRVEKLGLFACHWWAGGPTILRCHRCGARG